MRFVKASSPLMSTAFRELERDSVFRMKIEKSITTARITYLQDKITGIEAELATLEKAKVTDEEAGKQRKKNISQKLAELDVKLQKEQAILSKLPSSY